MATQADIDAAQAELDELKAARTAILTRGQSVTADGKRLERADLAALTAEVTRLEAKLSRWNRTGQRQMVPK